jgi:hypothetical protein
MPRIFEEGSVGNLPDSVIRQIPKKHETIKMRYWLKAWNQTVGLGMSARHGFYTAFYDGMALNIPNYHSIWVQGTDEHLRRYPNKMWTVVIIWKTAPTYAEQQKLYDIGVVSETLGNIPIIGAGLNDWWNLRSRVEWKQRVKDSVREYPVWDNILYKHTLDDKILKANYGNVIHDILPLIVKKYG